jgi:hypothetical protein
MEKCSHSKQWCLPVEGMDRVRREQGCNQERLIRNKLAISRNQKLWLGVHCGKFYTSTKLDTIIE